MLSSIEKKAIKDGCSKERSKRLRAGGNAPYRRLEQASSQLAADRYTPREHKDRVVDQATFAFLNAVEVGPEEDAVTAWVDLILSGEQRPAIGSPDSTPGHCKNEDQGLSQSSRAVKGYPGGAKAYFEHLERWRKSGHFEGL